MVFHRFLHVKVSLILIQRLSGEMLLLDLWLLLLNLICLVPFLLVQVDVSRVLSYCECPPPLSCGLSKYRRCARECKMPRPNTFKSSRHCRHTDLVYVPPYPLFSSNWLVVNVRHRRGGRREINCPVQKGLLDLAMEAVERPRHVNRAPSSSRK